MGRRVEVRADMQRGRELLASDRLERQPLDPSDRRTRVPSEPGRVHAEVLREIQ